jgi:hypothetical protein
MVKDPIINARASGVMTRTSTAGQQEVQFMKVHTIGIAAQIRDISPGTCFAFRREGTTYLAVLLQEKEMATVLWPRHPGGQLPLGQFAIDDKFATESLWVLPDLVAAPPPIGLTPVQFPSAYKNQLGSLVLAGSDVLVTVPGRGATAAWLRLGTGELVYQLPSVFVWFDRWSIMQPGPDGVLQKICTIPEAAPPPAMRSSDEMLERALQNA